MGLSLPFADKDDLHLDVPGVGVGQRYAFRVDGDWRLFTFTSSPPGISTRSPCPGMTAAPPSGVKSLSWSVWPFPSWNTSLILIVPPVQAAQLNTPLEALIESNRQRTKDNEQCGREAEKK